MNKDILTFASAQGILLILIFFSVWVSRQSRLYNPDAVTFLTQSELILFDEMRFPDLFKLLEESDVDFCDNELVWAANTLGWRRFRSGRYLFDGSYSYGDFLSKLARGIQDPVSVTILPGSDPGRLSMSLAAQLRADSLSFALALSQESTLLSEFELTSLELFSRMLPNTYQMFWTSSPEAVIRRLIREFDTAVTNRFAEEILDHKLSLSEILTLASIVEWEARYDHEKPRIAGLYLNRLNRNMMLQADPTVAFALGERRRLLFEDYRIDHPFNTYRISGLPPAPITNPSLYSIRAVIEPEEHNYLFMVATPKGTHRFSRTFEEHRIASEEWRRWLREQVRIRRELERAAESSQ